MWTSRKYQSIKASAGARAYNGGLGQKPGQEVKSGASPVKLKAL